MNEIDNVICLTLKQFDIRSFEDLINNNPCEYNKVIVIHLECPIDNDFIQALSYMKTIIKEDIYFELQCQIIIEDFVEDKWDSEVYSQHGGYFKDFWFQERYSKYPIKKNIEIDMKIGLEYLFVYSIINDININELQYKYLELIGGQSHVKCETHKKPFVISYDKKLYCICNKVGSYCCPDNNCKSNICKDCFSKLDKNMINFIKSNHYANTNRENNVGLQVDGNVGLQVDADSNREINNENNIGLRVDAVETFIVQQKDIEDFVSRVDETEQIIDDSILLNETNNNVNISQPDFFPTTNAGELCVEVEEKVGYGFKFSGCNILNNAGSLLSRSLFDIRKSKYINHHIQKLCSVINCKSIPLLYPEGMLFPSIHWKTAYDDVSVVGAIPSSLLNVFIEKEGFASIQQHLLTRLKSASSSTCSDPRYITHCYDVMANLAASTNDTRLIINRGLTVGNDIKNN